MAYKYTYYLIIMKIPEMAWRTQINHILLQASVYCPYISSFKTFNIISSFYSVTAIAMPLSILGISFFFYDAYVDFLHEGARVWMKCTLHVFIALDNGQSILFWVKIWKILPLSKEMLSRHNNPCFFQCTEVYRSFLLLICCKKNYQAIRTEPNRKPWLKTEVRIEPCTNCIVASLVRSQREHRSEFFTAYCTLFNSI